jgi:hypothetical protein
MHVGEVEDRANPAGALGDLDDVVDRAEVPDATHHLDPEGHGSIFAFQSLTERAELLDNRVDRICTTSSQKETGVEDHELGAACCSDACAPVEGSDGRRELAPTGFEMAHESEERRMHGQRDVVCASELSELLRERIVHPEPALEIDLAR